MKHNLTEAPKEEMRNKQWPYEGRSFNCVTNGPPYRVAVRSMWKLQWFHGRVIFYNRMKFRSNPFSLSKVIESSSWFSHIHSILTVCKMKNKTSFKRSVSYPWQRTCSQVCSCPRLLERGKGSSALLSTLFARPLLKTTLSGRRYESRSALGSAIYQCIQGIPKKAYFSAFTEWISRFEKCVSVKGEYFEGLK